MAIVQTATCPRCGGVNRQVRLVTGTVFRCTGCEYLLTVSGTTGSIDLTHVQAAQPVSGWPAAMPGSF